MAPLKRIVVLGGGFAGAYAARRLAQKLPDGWELTIIDRQNFMVFYPLLIEAGVGSLEPRHVVIPIRDFVRRADFRMARIESLDVTDRTVIIRSAQSESSEALRYDQLVIALGSVTLLPPVPGLKEHGFELKSLADAIGLRDRAVRMLEEANAAKDDDLRRELLQFVVVGASFSGVEFAGEYHDFLSDAVRQYPNLCSAHVSVVLLERADRILPALESDLAGFAARHLSRRGVKIRTGTTATRIDKDCVSLSTSEVLRTRTVVWCAGIAPNPVLASQPDLPTDERGWILCDPDLRVQGFEDVYVAGDMAKVVGTSTSGSSATAQTATRQGMWVSENILRTIKGGPTKPFTYKEAGSIAALGCRTAVARLMGLRFAGFFAWFLYRTVYLFKMPSWSRKLRIMFDWTADFFFRREIVQLGLADDCD